MSLGVFQRCLDFVQRSGIDQIRILGGEPTLHPEFAKMIELAMETGKRVFLFTNGLFRDELLNFLMSFPFEKLSVMVNVTPRFRTPERENSRQRFVLNTLGPRAMLSCTVYRPDVSLNGMLDLINLTGVERRVRLGISLPSLTENNEWLSPREYRFVGSRIADFAIRAARQNIFIGLDCGFVPCMFTKTEIQTLKECDADLGWNCSPILDIDPTGKIFHCFPLADVIFRQLPDSVEPSEIRNHFLAANLELHDRGIFKRCSYCEWKKENICPGGCLAVTLKQSSAYVS